MIMSRYFSFPKVLGLEPHHQIQFSVIYKTLSFGGLPTQQRCSRRIVQTQPTWIYVFRVNITNIIIFLLVNFNIK